METVIGTYRLRMARDSFYYNRFRRLYAKSKDHGVWRFP